MISLKRVFLLGISCLFLVLGTGLKVAPNRLINCSEPATRMAAFLPMVKVSATQNGSGKYATVYDCAEWGNPQIAGKSTTVNIDIGEDCGLEK